MVLHQPMRLVIGTLAVVICMFLGACRPIGLIQDWTPQTGVYKELRCSPDGKTIAMLFAPPKPVAVNIWLLDANGKNFRQSTQQRPFQAVEAYDWLSNGQLVYASRQPSPSALDAYYTLSIANKDGTGIQQIAEGLPGPMKVAWHPQGQFGILQLKDSPHLGCCNRSDLYKFDLATKSYTPFLSKGKSILYPVWSSGGERLAYVVRGDSGYQIEILNIATGENFSVSGRAVGPDNLLWSSDSKKLLYIAGGEGDLKYIPGIYAVDAVPDATPVRISPAGTTAVSVAWCAGQDYLLYASLEIGPNHLYAMQLPPELR